MRYYFVWLFVFLFLITGCTSGTLLVNTVAYQSLRTDFAQPKSIPNDAKIAVEYFFNSKGEMQPVVFNLTSEVMILDQTKSFLIMPNGTSISYYDPTVHVTTTGTYDSKTNGASLNLGGITSALGIGGVLGSLASSINVGSSNTSGLHQQNTVTVTDQPQVFIGPKGRVAMSKAYTIDGIGFPAIFSFVQPTSKIDVSHDASTVKFSVCVTYSVDNGATFDKLVTNLYLSSDISVPVNNRKVSDAFNRIYELKPDALVENMYMFLIPNNIERETTDIMGEFLTHSNVYDEYIYGSLIDFK